MKVTQLSPQQRAELAAQSLTYDEVGATKQELPAAYGHLLRTVTLPADCDFERACAALRQWQVPLRSGVKVAASTPQVGQDEVVVLAIGIGPFRVKAPCRVVYLIDEPDRCGFAYGTLQGHPVSGEEAFIIHRTPDGVVWLTSRSLTRAPRGRWRIAYPLALAAQRVYRRRYLRALCGQKP